MKEMNQEGVEEVLGMSKKVKSKKIKKIKILFVILNQFFDAL